MQVTLVDHIVYDFEEITITNAAISSFTATKYRPASGAKPAKSVFCRLETTNCYYQLDGSTTVLTTGSGLLLKADETLELLNSSDIVNFRIISTGANATLKVFYRR